MFRIAVSTGLAILLLSDASHAQSSAYDGLIATHAAANGVPQALVHRVMMRESRGNARIVSRGNYGLMQIRLQTARGMGYNGSADGLLDPNTNLTYAVKYLAGALRAAGGNHDRAIHYYTTGYYYAAKRQRTAQASTPAVSSRDVFNPPATAPQRKAQSSSVLAGPLTLFEPATPRAQPRRTPPIAAAQPFSDTALPAAPTRRKTSAGASFPLFGEAKPAPRTSKSSAASPVDLIKRMFASEPVKTRRAYRPHRPDRLRSAAVPVAVR